MPPIATILGMPRRLLKRFIPSQARLRSIKGFGFIGERLFHPALWHLSRRSVRNAFFIGVLFAFIPLPAHVLFAAFVAVWARCNVALTCGLVWLNNPLTIGPMYYGAYRVGAWILGQQTHGHNFQFHWSSLRDVGGPFVLGCVVIGVLCGVVAALAIDVLWRFSVRKAWRTRTHVRTHANDGQHWRLKFRAQQAERNDRAPEHGSDCATPDAAPALGPDAPRAAPDTARQPG